MILVVFRSRFTPAAEAGAVRQNYLETAERILDLAHRARGFISFKSFTSDDGERVSLVEFESDEDVRAWKENLEHLEAQEAGKKQDPIWIKITPSSKIAAYGIGVKLLDMRKPEKAHKIIKMK